MKLRKNTIAFAAAACSLLGVNVSEAAVTLTFAQVGQNVTATWSGTYLTYSSGGGVATYIPGANIASNSVIGLTGAQVRSFGQGNGNTFTNTPLVGAVGTYAGGDFGYIGTTLYYPNAAHGGTVFSPAGTMTFANTTLAALGAGQFNNTLVFTGGGSVAGSREIRLDTIPEPSSILLLGLGAAGFVTRRQRKHTI